jgi:hypothetical protein
VLAPNAKLRAQPVPTEPPADADARLAREAVEPHPDNGHRWGSRISWALLLKWVFEIDMQRCSNCRGKLKAIAAI